MPYICSFESAIDQFEGHVAIEILTNRGEARAAATQDEAAVDRAGDIVLIEHRPGQ